MTSNVKFMNFYPFEDIETISPRPMLFIAGDKRTPASSARTPTSSPPNPRNYAAAGTSPGSGGPSGSTKLRSAV